MKCLSIAAAFALAIPAVPAFAGFIDGNTLYGWCLANDPATKYQADASCLSFIEGVADHMELMSDKQCVRPGVTARQLADVVIKSLRDHPEERDHGAAYLGHRAIENAFCPSKG
ncbi:Rap1a/Tai family immunity protein [Rhizobium ruizarguesonis]|uniref:Rap1a/Tai family immunity protein n=1 Tax=Rhizobium ruizarguesonis TaxID=2081791 RepID=UPI000368DD73|nr:Rap1a/Tai family immunity protein [Rhizobium ruizarguesonis]NEH75067.1 hypothetical protein [Rhizobium ruizarguesonis]NEI76094.1 hypothetical protein [Rhizobium ruizarguesonis]WSH61095.1 Rap1a/Tai family immunity protein [Rhizobium ruizarguesonis]